jgi:hypothetical protein
LNVTNVSKHVDVLRVAAHPRVWVTGSLQKEDGRRRKKRQGVILWNFDKLRPECLFDIVATERQETKATDHDS